MEDTEIILTREEKYAKCTFEWIKTDRAGEVCYFSHFQEENGIEYTCFNDNSRVRTDLIGDIILKHDFPVQVLGNELSFEQRLMGNTEQPIIHNVVQPIENVKDNIKPTVESEYITDPVISLLDKAKKKVEKINLSLTVKIPSVDLYSVIRDNFNNSEDILLDNVMQQIKDDILRDALKKELQNIYSKKKINNGK